MNKSKQNTNLNIEEGRARVLEKHEYTIIKKLREGGLETAFLVQSKEGGTYVITEIIYRDVEDLDKIKEEIKILTSLKNPYFVDYYESFEDKEAGLLYTVMENCTGEDLYTMMKAQGKNGVFDELQILDWFVQICLALQDLHEKGVLHRDIKPQNVFLTKEGYIILCRFGCLKAMERADESGESVVGTDLYVSPEVFSHSYDFKSDIWSLGWLLHDLCMLNVWSDINERHNAHDFSMKGNPPSIEERYSEELRELIKEMLCRDPKDRPSTDEILAKPFLKDAVDRSYRIPKALKEKFMEDTEIFEKTYGDLKAFLSEWEKTTDLLEEVHRKCTIGSLSGSVIGAAGGITALVGAILIPFTFGASVIVSAVGASVGIAGGVTSAASNIANAVQQKSLRESLERVVEKYENISKPILNSSDTLMLLRKIQTFIIFIIEKMIREVKFVKISMVVLWWVDRSTFTLLYAAQLVYQCLLANLTRAGAEAGVEAGVRAGVQAGIQATRVGRAVAAAAEAVVAVAAVSGVLSGLLIIADAVFIGIDSREIHQMRRGKIDDPEKVSSSVLKGIAQMRKMHKGLENILKSIIETREYIKQNCMSHTRV